MGGGQAKAAAFDPDRAFPVGPISGTATHQIVRLDRVASTLADRHTIVNCWSQRDWTRFQSWQGTHHLPIDPLGVTFFETRRIQLSPFVCQVLAQLFARSAQQPLYTATAITVLAHESAHASGIKAENLAECRAIKTEPQAAQLLGLPRALGARLQHIYRGTIYPGDEPRYRTPPCKAGLPGLLVPDTFGTSANLRPLRRMAAAVVRSLPGWQNLEGGGGTVGPLSPCTPIRSRTLALARIGETIVKFPQALLGLAASTFRTQKDFAAASARYRPQITCDLADLRRDIRESHRHATVSSGPIPAAIKRISPRVRAFREVWAQQGLKWNRDTIFVFDPAKRTTATLFFKAPVGDVPVSLEVHATRAALNSLR